MDRRNFLTALEMNNLTQKELAERIGVSEVTISRYLSDDRTPRSDILQKMSLELNCSMEFLLGESDDPNPVFITNKKPTLEDIKAFKEKYSVKMKEIESKIKNNNNDIVVLDGTQVSDIDFNKLKKAIELGLFKKTE